MSQNQDPIEAQGESPPVNLDTLPEEIAEQVVAQVRRWTDAENEEVKERARR